MTYHCMSYATLGTYEQQKMHALYELCQDQFLANGNAIALNVWLAYMGNVPTLNSRR